MYLKQLLKKERTHDNLIHTCSTGEPLRREVISIRSFKHDLYLYSQDKVALTSYYDKMKNAR